MILCKISVCMIFAPLRLCVLILKTLEHSRTYQYHFERLSKRIWQVMGRRMRASLPALAAIEYYVHHGIWPTTRWLIVNSGYSSANCTIYPNFMHSYTKVLHPPLNYIESAACGVGSLLQIAIGIRIMNYANPPRKFFTAYS